MDNRYYEIIKHTTNNNSSAATSLLHDILNEKVSDLIRQQAREHKLPTEYQLKD